MERPAAKRRSAAGRVIEIVTGIELALCEIAIVVLALLTTLEVICREFLGVSLMVSDEVGGYLLVAITFLGIGVALGSGALFRVAFLIDRLSPGMKRAVELLFNLLALLVSVILDWQMIRLVEASYERGVVAATILATPLYIPQSVTVIGMTGVVVVLVCQILDDLLAPVGTADE